MRPLAWEIEQYPQQWRTAVEVSRGGRDRYGNPLPQTTFEIPQVLVGWSSSEDQPRMDVPEDTAVLYAPPETPDLLSSDLITIPDDHLGPRGRFQVTGTPRRSPFGIYVTLRKV